MWAYQNIFHIQVYWVIGEWTLKESKYVKSSHIVPLFMKLKENSLSTSNITNIAQLSQGMGK